MASTLVRAIITGFGLKLGSEVAKVLSQKLESVRTGEPASVKAEDEDEELPCTTADPPSFDGSPC